jgi:hypothetical protein
MTKIVADDLEATLLGTEVAVFTSLGGRFRRNLRGTIMAVSMRLRRGERVIVLLDPGTPGGYLVLDLSASEIIKIGVGGVRGAKAALGSATTRERAHPPGHVQRKRVTAAAPHQEIEPPAWCVAVTPEDVSAWSSRSRRGRYR